MTAATQPFQNLNVKIHDEFADHIGGPDPIVDFEISVYDAAKLSGHLCPSVAGAFLMTRAAILALFPETNGVCKRGLLKVDIPYSNQDGATGPMSHVISYLTGAWDESGFGGLQGKFVRKKLLNFESPNVPEGSFRFERIDNHQAVEVSYHPELSGPPPANPQARGWQPRVEAILASADQVVKVKKV